MKTDYKWKDSLTSSFLSELFPRECTCFCRIITIPVVLLILCFIPLTLIIDMIYVKGKTTNHSMFPK